jgi:hypothetical protein
VIRTTLLAKEKCMDNFVPSTTLLDWLKKFHAKAPGQTQRRKGHRILCVFVSFFAPLRKNKVRRSLSS